MYQLDANNFIMISSHEWPLHVSDIYMSIFRSSYMLFHCRIWHNTTCGSETTYKNSWRWTCKCPKHV